MKPFKIMIALLTAVSMIVLGITGVQGMEIDLSQSAADMEIPIVAAEYDEVGSILSPEEPLPSSYSSKDLGYTTGILYQQFNTCWAYSSQAAFESLLLKNGESISHLSTMHMNYWATPDSKGNGWQRGYTDAGYPYIPLGYLTSWSGAYTEEAYPVDTPFEAFDRSILPNRPLYGATAVIYLDGSDKETIKTAVKENGGAAASFHYSRGFLNENNYYCYQEGLSTAQLFGHSVEIIGWDDNYKKENFRTEVYSESQVPEEESPTEPAPDDIQVFMPENDGAWLCKNSWGEYFGDRGYFWISYEDRYLFDHRFGPVFSIMDYQAVDENTKMYQNEIYGADCQFDFIEQLSPATQELTFSNVFDFSDKMTQLDKIIFETETVGAEYTVFYIPVDQNGAPVTDKNRWVSLSQGTVGYEGFICVDIKDRVLPEGKAAVGITLKKTAPSQVLGVGVGEWITSGGRYIFTPDSEDRQSYLLGYEDEAIDVMDFYKTYLDDEIGGTLVIKAVAKRSEYVSGDVDHDGKLSIVDATHIQRMLAALETFSDEQDTLGDYDLDGKVTVVDVTYIQRHLAGF